jgi:histidine kinase
VAEKVGELERERAKMVQMDKMAALGQMATGVAHELNQPLTAISFEIDYLELLARQADEAARPFQMATDAVRELAENLRGDVARCRRLIDHLRDFGRASGGEAVPVDLNGPIEDSLILVGARLREHGVDVQLDLAEVLPPVAADANRLEQVFLNLISNAEHALEAASEDAPPEWHKVLALATRRQGGQVVAEVRDNGCGIPTELQPHIFEPFFTTKPVGEGTGLGLSISYGIVTELGGEITFESAEGKGTTFLLRFPVLA